MSIFLLTKYSDLYKFIICVNIQFVKDSVLAAGPFGQPPTEKMQRSLLRNKSNWLHVFLKMLTRS